MPLQPQSNAPQTSSSSSDDDDDDFNDSMQYDPSISPLRRSTKIDDYPIVTSLDEAGRAVLDHSFAIYRVPPITHRKIQAAHRAALRFFHETTESTIYDDVQNGNHSNNNNNNNNHHRLRRIVNGHLYGFNVPSNAKHLFRAYCYSDHQPWQSDGELRMASISLVQDLHAILRDCCHHIIEQSNRDQNRRHSAPHHQRPQETEGVNNDDRISSLLSRTRKRGRNDDNMPKTEDLDDGERLKTVDRSIILPSHYYHIIPETAAQARNCPLDYFFYHNRNPTVENCSAHVDRGVLIVVCLTNVPGLEVCPRGQLLCNAETNRNSVGRTCMSILDTSDGTTTNDLHSFNDEKYTIPPICPEVLVHNEKLYQEVEDTSSTLVCIMAGDQLSSILHNEHITRCHPIHRLGCVHRVRQPLKRARLSISYELRL